MTSVNNFGVRFLSRGDGLGSGQVHRVHQDSHGVMWFAGPSGLGRFDGARVTRIGRSQGLTSHGLRTLGVHNQQLVVGTDCGIDLVNAHGGVTTLREFDVLRPGFVQAVLSLDSTLLVGASRGMFRWNGPGNAEPVRHELIRGVVSDLVIDGGGHVWATGPEMGVLHSTDTVDWSDSASEVTSIDGTLLRLMPLSAGVLKSTGNGLEHVTTAGSKSIVDDLGFVVNVMTLGRGFLWLGGPSGLFRLPMSVLLGAWDPRQLECVVPEVAVSDIFTDNQTNIWVGTDGHGAARISAAREAMSRPLSSRQAMMCIRPTSDGWLAGGDGEVWKLGDSTPHIPTSLPGFDTDRIWDIVEDEGRTFAATQRGLIFVENGVEEAIRSHQVLLAPARSLLTVENQLWVGTLEGLAVLSTNDVTQVTEVTEPTGESLGYVYSLEQTSRTRIAVACLGNGLWWADANLKMVERETRVPSKSNVYSVCALHNGSIAVLVDDSLLILANDGSVLSTTTTDRSVFGWSVKVDPAGDLWIGTSEGLELRHSDSGRLKRRIDCVFDSDDWEFTTSRSLAIEPTGTLLCGTQGGLLKVSPDLSEIGGPLPFLESAQIRNGARSASGELTVPCGRWTLDIQFSPRWYVDEQHLSFRYRLVGFESEWTETDQSQCTYTSLPSGTYTLEAQCFWGPTGWSQASRLLAVNVIGSTRAEKALKPFLWAQNNFGRQRKHEQVRHELEQKVHERTLELSEVQQKLEALNQELKHLASIDSLTGLANRRSFEASLATEIARSVRSKACVSLIMIDIDFFKGLNDHFGHLVGDGCLQNVAWAVSKVVREYSDLTARFGGEEFAVLLPGIDGESAHLVAERIREAVRNLGIENPNSELGIVTISLGVACHNPYRQSNSVSISDLLETADRALYAAKARGRDRTEVYGQLKPLPRN
jgi:diguanylate cyclase (GGDEF)-like protein